MKSNQLVGFIEKLITNLTTIIREISISILGENYPFGGWSASLSNIKDFLSSFYSTIKTLSTTSRAFKSLPKLPLNQLTDK